MGVDLEPGLRVGNLAATDMRSTLNHTLGLSAITSSFSGRPFERPVASQASSSSTTPCASKRSRSAARQRALNSAAHSIAKRVSCATELMSAAGSSVDRSTAPPPGTGTGLLTKVLVLDSSDRAAASAEQSMRVGTG